MLIVLWPCVLLLSMREEEVVFKALIAEIFVHSIVKDVLAIKFDHKE